MLTLLLIMIESVNLFTQSSQNNQLIVSFTGLQYSYERQLITADLLF